MALTPAGIEFVSRYIHKTMTIVADRCPDGNSPIANDMLACNQYAVSKGE